MKRRIIIVAAFAAFIAILAAIAWFSPASVKGFTKNGVAIVAQSWRDVFSHGDAGPLATEIDLGSETVATGTVSAVDPSAPPVSPAPPAPTSSLTPAANSSVDDAGGDSSGDLSAGLGIAPAPEHAPVPVEVVPPEPPPDVKKSLADTIPRCTFPGAVSSSPRKVILNEIAWMGSVPVAGESSSRASGREWIELKNISWSDTDLSGWQLVNAAGTIKVVFRSGENISAGGFSLLVRGDDAVPAGATAAKIYSGTLSNAGGALALFDSACNVLDALNAIGGWPGGDNATKQTLERDADGNRWHTSMAPGGTPGAENSVPHYLVRASFAGQGTGLVSADPAGIHCGFECKASYAAGTALAFTATPAANSIFSGWSGPCGGQGTCAFTVTSSVAVLAEFDLKAPPFVSGPAPPVVYAPPAGTTATSTPIEPAACIAPSLVVSEVQIAGAASSNDFVRIQNPTASAVDLGGWTLRKRSSTGADSSVREFPKGSMVLPGGTFLWANSAGGFGDSIGANATSAATLAAGNSIALFDAQGTIMDAVAWGNGTDQYVEGAPYPGNPEANRTLKRKFDGGAIIDTDNNADDFTI